MLHLSRDSGASRNVTTASVLDLLLRGTFSENGKTESAKRCRFDVIESEADNIGVGSPECKRDIHSSKNATLCSSYAETKTPTTRLDQLPILLARNYFTAPACLLEFINTTSTIHHGALSNRDSEVTIIDYEDDQLVNCSLDTNDEVCELREDSISSADQSGTLTRTSLASNETIAEPGIESLSYFDGNSVGYLQQSDATSQLLDSTDSEPKNYGHVSRNSSYSSVEIRTKICVDRGTSPLVLPKSVSIDTQVVDSYKSIAYAENPSTLVTNAESPCVSLAKTSYVSGRNPKRPIINEEINTEYPSYVSYSNAITKSVETQKELPVYCRSLLYRIRVPLSKRLKNGPDGHVSDLNSHCLSISRTNLSCDRVFSSSNRSSQRSSESTYSILRLSDLADDTTHSDSSTSYTFFKSNRIVEDGSCKDRLETPYSEYSDRKGLGLYVEGKYLRPGRLTLLDGEEHNIGL